MFSTTYFRSPAEWQGDEKLVVRLIQLFSSTEIFSKRRKIYAFWRTTRVNWQKEESDPCLTLCCKTCGTNNLMSTFMSMRKTYIQKRFQSLLPLLPLLPANTLPCFLPLEEKIGAPDRRLPLSWTRVTKTLETTLKILRLILVPRPIS